MKRKSIMQSNIIFEGNEKDKNVAYAMMILDKCYVGQTSERLSTRIYKHTYSHKICKFNTEAFHKAYNKAIKNHTPIIIKHVKVPENASRKSYEGLLYNKMEDLGFYMLNKQKTSQNINDMDTLGNFEISPGRVTKGFVVKEHLHFITALRKYNCNSYNIAKKVKKKDNRLSDTSISHIYHTINKICKENSI